MTIGNRYTIELEAAEGLIRLDGICRWNIETSYGFVNGCSIRPGEGQLLACREFRGTVLPRDTAPSPGNESVRREETPDEPKPAASSESPRPLLTTTTILLLSAVLIGLSIRTLGPASDVAFLAGCFGFVAYIGLGWTVRRGAEEQNEERQRNTAESRLAAHVAIRKSPTRDPEPEPKSSSA